MRQTSQHAAGGAGSAYVALMLGHAAQGLTFTAFTPALGALAKDFDATGQGALIAQLCVTIAAAGIIAGALLSGWIVARVGARRTMLASLAVYGLAGSAGLFVADPFILLVSRMVVGFVTACTVTACVATIAANYPPQARTRVIGGAVGAGSVASLVGLVLGGMVAERFGWRMAFLQYPVFGLGGLLLALAAFPATAMGVEIEQASSRGSGAWSLWPLYGLAVVIAAVMFMGSTQFAFLLPHVGVKSPGAIGLVMSALTLLGAIVSFQFGRVEKRLGLQGALILGLAAVAAGMVLIGLARSPLAAVVGAALMGTYVGIVMPYLHHVATIRAAPTARGQAIGLVSAFTFLGGLINPLVFAPISAALGVQGLFVVVGSAMAAMAAGALALRLRSPAPVPAE